LTKSTLNKFFDSEFSLDRIGNDPREGENTLPSCLALRHYLENLSHNSEFFLGQTGNDLEEEVVVVVEDTPPFHHARR